jgi:hypothetical protein
MRIWAFIIVVVILYALTSYFMILLLDTGVSVKYEIFEPTETYHYTTLKTTKEKEDYIKKVDQHAEFLYKKEVLYKALSVLTFLSASGLLIFRKRILKVKRLKTD